MKPHLPKHHDYRDDERPITLMKNKWNEKLLDLLAEMAESVDLKAADSLRKEGMSPEEAVFFLQNEE